MPPTPDHDIRQPTVLLLHGMLSGSAHWGPLRAEMPGVRFVAVDIPGYGSAPGPHGRDYSLDRIVDLLAPVIGVEQPRFVVGHSMGAIVALALAQRLPGQFERVGVIALPVYGDWRQDPSVLQVERISRRLRFYLHPRAHAVCRVLNRTSGAWIPMAPLVRKRRSPAILRSYFNHSGDAHHGSARQIVFSGLVPALAAALAIPVSALHGDRDRAAPIAPVEALAKEHRWRFRTVRNGGHQTLLYRPALIAQWLREDVLAAP